MSLFRLRFCLIVCFCFVLLAPSHAQAPDFADQNQSFFQILGRDLVQEKTNLGVCGKGLKGIPGCAQTIFTGTPLHIAVGSLPPQNGIGLGLSFAEVWHPTYCAAWIDFQHAPEPSRRNACHWSVDINADGQASGNGSWRTGVYLNATHQSARTPAPHYPGQPRRAPITFGGPSPTVGFYSESSSLNRVYYFGLGRGTTPAARTDFGFFENITGINTVIPLKLGWFSNLGLSLHGEANGRFPSVRGSYGDSSPSIEAAYTEASAPGLASQPNFIQTGEGIRLIPAIPKNRLALNYSLDFQQFIAPSASHYSFRRLTADLDHTLVLYKIDKGRPPLPPSASGPTLPPISATRDISGTISARMLITASEAGAGSVVPFYFSPTIGGSDINGESILASYPDYRFRAPNLLLIHGDYEQSLGKIPIGLFIGLDEAKVGLRRDDISFNHLSHSYSAGLTIHAGGLPVVYLLFAWGGKEGHHFIGNINSSLLGVSTRPSLY